jgi:hypothetical protein
MTSMKTTTRHSVRDFAFVLRAACVLAVLRLVMRLAPADLLRRCPRVAARRNRRQSPEQVVRAVSAASRLTGGTCLTRALGSRLLLARAGVPVTLAIGARENARIAPFQAHAWIEHRGRPVIHGEPVPAFAAVWRLAPDATR